MSADNGIYILKTLKGDGHEYRVAHLQAVGNYLWKRCSVHGSEYDFLNCEECNNCNECNDPKEHIANAREMWNKSDVYVSKDEAFTKANEIYDTIINDDFCPILEYGISYIVIDMEF